MKDQLVRIERAVEAAGRAVFPRGEACELRLDVLPRPILQRRLQRHRDFDHLGRQFADFRDDPGDLGGLRHLFERDHGIAVDGRLAGEDRAAVRGPLVVDGARLHGDPARLALAGTAVVRNDHPAAEAGIHQGLADPGADRLAVDDELARVGHGRELEARAGAVARAVGSGRSPQSAAGYPAGERSRPCDLPPDGPRRVCSTTK